MKKFLTICLILAMTVTSLAGCGGEKAPSETSSETSVSSESSTPVSTSTSTESTADESMPEEATQLDTICKLMTENFEKVNALAKENGWTADEKTVAELEAIPKTLEAANILLQPPYEVDKINQVIPVLEAMLSSLQGEVLTRVSVPYGTEDTTKAAAELVTMNVNGVSIPLPSGISMTDTNGVKVYSEDDFMFSVSPATETTGTAAQVTEEVLETAVTGLFVEVEQTEFISAADSNGMPLTRATYTGKNANGASFTIYVLYCFPTEGQYVTIAFAYLNGANTVIEQNIDTILAGVAPAV